MIEFKPNGLIFAGSYLVMAWIMGSIAWSIYERKLKRGLARERVSEYFGTGRRIHYITMLTHIFFAIFIALVYWYFVRLALIFLDQDVKAQTLMVSGGVIGAVFGYILESPSKDERVDYSDSL